MNIKWRPISDKSYEEYDRVLVYSPIVYADYVDKTMLYRVLDSNYVNRCSEVSHWSILEEPKG